MRVAEMQKLGLTKIKPCPFCGGFSTLAKKSKTIIKGELAYTTYVYCTDCQSRGRRVLLGEDERDDTESRELAISHWNRRTIPYENR